MYIPIKQQRNLCTHLLKKAKKSMYIPIKKNKNLCTYLLKNKEIYVHTY